MSETSIAFDWWFLCAVLATQAIFTVRIFAFLFFCSVSTLTQNVKAYKLLVLIDTYELKKLPVISFAPNVYTILIAVNCFHTIDPSYSD